mgnify:CR=1 FL=1
MNETDYLINIFGVQSYKNESVTYLSFAEL